MKSAWLYLLILFSVNVLQAEEFHPYNVKSGKITFEKKKYFMDTKLHVASDGTTTKSRINPSYVEEEITYYWDNYGDVAYEVSYQISKFGGKLLPKKVKKYEKLWKGNYRYYYNVKKKKVSIDPFYKRNRCIENAYKVNGCFKIMHSKALFIANSVIQNKQVKYYKESESNDYYLWNGLILRDMSYSTKKRNGKYKRFEPNREKIAVKIEENIKINASVFKPRWLNK